MTGKEKKVLAETSKRGWSGTRSIGSEKSQSSPEASEQFHGRAIGDHDLRRIG